jgi:peptide deformylase
LAKLKIYTFPDAVLTKKAKPIERVEKGLWKTADDMLETMYYAPGIGLAANQVGLLDRIIVIDTEYESVDLEPGQSIPEGSELIQGSIVSGKKPIVLVNPEIIHAEGFYTMEEGCLSVPEYCAEVKRAEKIKVRYQNLDGVTKELHAEGLQAACVQHEIDHLEGRLFIDRLSTLKREFAKKKLIKARKESDEQ